MHVHVYSQVVIARYGSRLMIVNDPVGQSQAMRLTYAAGKSNQSAVVGYWHHCWTMHGRATELVAYIQLAGSHYLRLTVVE